jgi:predicted nucleic acid-binding protein/ribosomal protein S18 acetylase RimI-like enzyme
MSEKVLGAPADVIAYLDQIRRLADANREALGFLPATAYEEAAMKGRLWVAVEENATTARDLHGYLFFGDRFPRLRVYQIYVCPEFRTSGTARTLIERLKGYGEDRDYLTITARVASDLRANGFWKSLGFAITGRFPGGKRGRTINRYAFALDVPSLFNQHRPSIPPVAEPVGQKIHVRPILPTPVYVIDLNVLFDAVRDRDDGEALRTLSMGFDSDIRLAVTSEFTRELQRHSRQTEKDPVLKLARALPTLPEPRRDVLDPLVAELRGQLLSTGSEKTGRRATNDASDLIHLASCIHHRVYGFITRDSAILQRADELHDRYDLRILSPADLCEPLEDSGARPERITALVGQQAIEISAFDEPDRAHVEAFLHDLGISPDDVAACLAPGTTRFAATRSVVRAARQVVGIGTWVDRMGAGRESVAHLYADEHSQHVDRVVDHLLEHSVSRGAYGQLSRVDLKIGPGQVKIRDVAMKRGFCPPDFKSGATSEALSKVSMKVVVTEGNWRFFRSRFRDATGRELPRDLLRYDEMVDTGVLLDSKKIPQPIAVSLFEFETIISPGALICPGRSAVMVPVQERYAHQLLSLTRSQGSLLADREAVLRLERAYFLAAGKHRLFPRGTIVVFYASRTRCEAVAMARVTFSDTLTKKEAALNLCRQGVLSEEEIDQRSDRRDEVATFTFDNLMPFPKGIPHRELRRLGCIGGANLVTAQKLPYDKLLLVVERAFDMEAS